MHYLLDLLQGLGIAAAVGIRPFLPSLLVGALAAKNIGVDFGGTDFSFLESPWFLLALVLAVIVLAILERRSDGDLTRTRVGLYVLLVIALALGALQAAGSIADGSSTWWPGLPIGLAAAGLAFAAVYSLFGRVRARLDAAAASALPVYAEGCALVAAGLAVLLPPLSIVIVAGLAWLLLGGRRRAGEKYAGLRILR
jgi:Domain of unknown function (DUF4126)